MLAVVALLLASHAVHPVDLPAAFGDVLPRVARRTSVPVLLPATMPTDQPKVYASGDGRRGSWTLTLASRPSCGADACFVASFGATRAKGARPFGPVRVRLPGGRHGRFQPLSCGASCAPPQISWRQHGATYSIQAAVGTRRTERRILVRMASSAIWHGAR
jgi:hypothetical protein